MSNGASALLLMNSLYICNFTFFLKLRFHYKSEVLMELILSFCLRLFVNFFLLSSSLYTFFTFPFNLLFLPPLGCVWCLISECIKQTVLSSSSSSSSQEKMCFSKVTVGTEVWCAGQWLQVVLFSVLVLVNNYSRLKQHYVKSSHRSGEAVCQDEDTFLCHSHG